MVTLRLDGVSKRYADTTALADASLRVEDGEFFTLVGPSGCGKTTTLRLVAGFEEPSSGSVRFGDREMRGVPPEDRGVGVVFQNYALFPHMTVAENVRYGLRFSDPPGGVSADERVAELLELVDLPDAGDRSPDRLSGGQQQRVSLARALAPGPRLLLLDEPMSALDARLRERLRRTVREIQEDLGITTLYVTHDQEEALAVSDRVAVLRDGRVEQVGTPREVYHRPDTRFVAEFVGDNTLFEGRVAEVFKAGDETKGSGTTEAAAARGTVTVEGATFEVTGLDGVTPGDDATFCVRPGAFRRGANRNRFTADVVGSEFLGEWTRLHLNWRGIGVTAYADDPSVGRESDASTDVDSRSKVGTDAETLTLGFDPGDARVL